MKKLSFMILFAFLATAIFAQDETKNSAPEHMNTLFGNGKKTTVGWFVGPSVAYTQFSGDHAVLAGIQGGMIINHHLSVGLAVIGLAKSDYLTYNHFVDSTDVRLEGGYGGLLLEYTFFPKSVVHFSIPVLIGGGQFSYVDKDKTGHWDNEAGEWDSDHRTIDKDAIFVVEPGIRAEVNVLKFMRFGIGVTYRYTPDLDLMKTDKAFLNSFTAGATLTFGKF